ncbi:MAG TPA: GIY-YIG nuclease family protein [Roseateles sp.]
MSQAFIAFARSHGVEIDASKLDDSGKLRSLADSAKPQDRTVGVYVITNATNGHFYVGSSVRVGRRAWTHLNHLRRGNHHSISLQRAFDKYGEQAFSFSLLVRCASAEEAAQVEQRLLDICWGRTCCYNVSSSAFPVSTQEMQQKAADGRRRSPLFIAHAKAQMAKLQTPEARAASAAASRASAVHQANSRKQGERLRSLLSKPVIRTDLVTGEERTFASASDAMRHLGRSTASAICRAVKSGATAYGFGWRAAQ